MELNNNKTKYQTSSHVANGDDVTIVEVEHLDTSSSSANGFFQGEEAEEASLYDNNLLSKLDFSHLNCFNPQISPSSPGQGLRVRALATGDYDRERFSAMKACPGTYFVTLIEDTEKDQIIGAATLLIEKKFIRECASKGIIEEVVVSDQYRGKQLGKLIVATMIELGKAIGCYKITLNCTDQMIGFYTSLGFQQEAGNANFLMIRVPKST